MMRPADFVGDATIPDWLEIGRQPHSAELLAPSLVVATLGMACVSTAKRSIRHRCVAPYDRHQRVWSSAMASMTSWATDQPSCRPAKRRMSAAPKYRRNIVALIDVTYCGTAPALGSGEFRISQHGRPKGRNPLSALAVQNAPQSRYDRCGGALCPHDHFHAT